MSPPSFIFKYNLYWISYLRLRMNNDGNLKSPLLKIKYLFKEKYSKEKRWHGLLGLAGDLIKKRSIS